MTSPRAAYGRAVVARTLILAVAALGIAGAVYLVNGRPSTARRVRQNEIARFSPAFGHGVTQLLGEAALVVISATVGRRILKIRL